MVVSASYDVFISFRGEDTRLGFTGFLYKTLCDRGFRVFFDDAVVEPMKAIEVSKVSIVIFSENYASSTYCLDELVCIIESYTKKKKSGLVFPVFYNVDPLHVHQALDVHQKNDLNFEKLKKWKNALKEAANLSCYHYKHGWVSIILYFVLFC